MEVLVAKVAMALTMVIAVTTYVLRLARMASPKLPARAVVGDFILNNKEYFVKYLDIKNGLLNKIVSRGILTQAQIKTVDGAPTEDESIGLLINFIVHGTALDNVQKLLTVFDETQHKHVAHFIRGMGRRRPEFGDDWPLSDEEIQALDDNLCQLIELIDSRNGLVEKMFAARCITNSQRERFVKCPVDADRNMLLVSQIRCSSVAIFRQFLRSLIETKQHHVVSLLKPDLVQGVHPLNDEEQYCIVSNTIELSDNICIDVVFLAELVATDCITTRQRQFIESATTPSDRCMLLLDMIRRGSQKDYQGFIECLRRTSQAHVIELLKVEQVVNEITNMKRLRDKLLMIIDVEHGLLDELLCAMVLTSHQYDDIRSRPTKKSVNLLIDYIIDMSSSELCENFLLALEKTHQTHVANYIRNNGYPGNSPNDWPLLESKSWVFSGDYLRLMELLDTTNGLLDELVLADCISSRHAERIAMCHTASSKNSTLLKIVQRGSIASYDKLIDCLSNTNQHVVAAILAPDHVGLVPPLTKVNEAKLTKINVILIRLIVTKNGLTQQMFDAGCITERQKRYIETAVSHSESNTRLLYILKRGSQADFDKFICCLERTNQQHVKCILTSRPHSVIDSMIPVLQPDTYGKASRSRSEPFHLLNP